MAHHNRTKKPAGFTLIELVVVIVIIGILSALGGQFIVAPITGYIDLSRRAKLVDQAEMSLRRMQRDIRAALPNSIIEDGKSVTMINTVDGGRYRRYQYEDEGLLVGDILEFNKKDTSFDVLGGLTRVPQAGEYLVVYNVSATGDSGNAYNPASGNRATVTGGDANNIKFTEYTFAQSSPYQRFFIVDKKITYRCENDELVRYETDATSTVYGEPSIVAKNVVTSDCEFTYEHGTTQRAGLVTLKLTLIDKEAEEEKVTLIHQVHVVNAP